MPFTKVWLGTVDNDANNAQNWQAISIRTPAFRWVASGSGTNEYYVELAAGGDPGIPLPARVLIADTAATQGTLGTLANLEWAYGDNDTLGFSTIYIRLNASDPDDQARDYVQFQQVPRAGDNVTLAGTAVRGIGGADFSAIAINAFLIEAGYRNMPIGSRETPLRIDPDSFESHGSGSQPWYIDISAAAIVPQIVSCPSPANGVSGLYLTGSAMAGIAHDRGDLALADLEGQTSSCTTIIVRGTQARLRMGAGLTWTTLRIFAGSVVARSNGTTVDATGGTLETQLAMTLTTANIQGGTIIDRSTGTFGAVNLNSGTYDTMQLTGAKTITAMKHNAGTFRENTELLTITTRSEADFAGITTRQRAG